MEGYGGSIYAPELITITLGHVLNAALIIALAGAAASFVDHPSTAAILTLAVTVGTWILSFIAAVYGGFWERPCQLYADRGRLAVPARTGSTGCRTHRSGVDHDRPLLTAIWNALGNAAHDELAESIAIVAIASWCPHFVNVSWDSSENRMNSFSRADEQALRQIHSPLVIEVHLAPEDPRRVDFDRRRRQARPRCSELAGTVCIGNVHRIIRAVESAVRRDLLPSERAKAMSRATTPEAVLETIYSLAGITPPAENDADIFRGHPLAAPPKGASVVFYFLWPACVAAAFFLQRRSYEHREVT